VYCEPKSRITMERVVVGVAAGLVTG